MSFVIRGQADRYKYKYEYRQPIAGRRFFAIEGWGASSAAVVVAAK